MSSASAVPTPKRSTSENVMSRMGRRGLREHAELPRQYVRRNRGQREANAQRDGNHGDDVERLRRFVHDAVLGDQQADAAEREDDADLHRPENTPNRRSDGTGAEIAGHRGAAQESLADR